MITIQTVLNDAEILALMERRLTIALANPTTRRDLRECFYPAERERRLRQEALDRLALDPGA